VGQAGEAQATLCKVLRICIKRTYIFL